MSDPVSARITLETYDQAHIDAAAIDRQYLSQRLLSLFRLRFKNAELERAFQVERRRLEVSSTRNLACLGLLVMVGFIWQDNLISPKYGYLAIYIRLYAGIPICVLAIWLTYYQKCEKWIDIITFSLTTIYYTSIIAILLVFQNTPYGLVSSTGLGNIMLFFFGVFGIAPLPFWKSTCSVLLLVIIYTVPCWILWAPNHSEFLLGDFLTVVCAGIIAGYISLTKELRQRERFVTAGQLVRQRSRYQDLLFQIVPPLVAQRIERGESPIADSLSEITILFSDLVGFSELTETIAPRHLVRLLNDLATEYDQMAERLGVERIKTIGDGYMAACGPPTDEDARAVAVAKLAREMITITGSIAKRHGFSLSLRVGIHTGSVVAGVIGKQRLTYDIWGKDVNIASRLEESGVPGKIQISQATYQRVTAYFECEKRGTVDLRPGEITTWLLGAPRREG